MSILSNMNLDAVETQKDTLGGYQPLETDIYPAIVKAVYLTTSKNGATAANLIADVGGKEYREQLWITNSKGEFFFTSKNGTKIALPGVTILNDICMCALEKPLKEMDTSPKVFKIYDYDAKTEIPKEVPTIVDLAGAQVYLGIVKEIVDKNVKDDTGNYVPSGETREQNVIEKVFHLGTKKTVNEVKEGVETAAFYDKWLAKNKNNTRNRAKGAGGAKGTAGAPQKAAAPKKSLFS